jgi:hypothetical protein
MVNQNVQAVENQMNTFYFNIYSEKGDGIINGDFVDFKRLPGKANVTCEDMGVGIKTCKMEWVPASSGLSTMRVSYVVSNKNFNTGDVVESTITNTFRIVKSPVSPTVE